jgi:hypothetical protein
MALTYSFPGPNGKAKSGDVRRDLAALIVRDGFGRPRTGILPQHNGGEVVRGSGSSMSVDVEPFQAVLVRDGVLFIANDSQLNVPAPAAPTANSRYHVLYLKQNESSPYNDTSDEPELAWIVGATSTDPSVNAAIAAIPDGGLRIASFLVPAGVTNMRAAGVVARQEYPYTALAGGLLYFRYEVERDSFTATWGQEVYVMNTETKYIRSSRDTWMVSGGNRPHIEFSSFRGMVDNQLQYPSWDFDQSLSNVDGNNSPVWTWEDGPGIGDPRGLLFNVPGDYDLICHWTLPKPTIGRGFIGFETESNTILARSHINAGEDRISVSLPAQRITKAGYRMRVVCYKDNGNLTGNTMRVKIVRTQ